MARTEKFSKEGEQTRRYYMGKRYGRAAVFGLVAGISATLSVCSAGKALTTESDNVDGAVVSQGQHAQNWKNNSNNTISGRDASADFNKFVEGINGEAVGYGGLAILFALSAFAAGKESRAYFVRGNAHFRREHNYG